VLADISWRWVFLSILPFGLLSIVMAIVFIPHLPGRKNARIDWVGALLILVSLGALSFSFITVSERGFAPGVLGWGIVGCIALVGFLIQNARSSDPLVPPAMFDRAVVVANVVTFFLYFAFQGVFFLLAFRLQQLHGYSARASGLALLPAIVLIALFTGPSGALTDKSGPRLQMIVGPLLVTAACAWWFVFHQGRFVTDILPGVILLGLGMVAAIPPVTKTALAVADRYSGAASGLNNGASRIAALFAIALAGSLLARVYAGSLNAQLQHRRFSSRIVRHERAHADQLLSAPLPAFGPRDELLRLRANAFSTGFRAAVALLGAAALCAGLVSLFRLPPQSPS
jgi:MFS family permease